MERDILARAAAWFVRQTHAVPLSLWVRQSQPGPLSGGVRAPDRLCVADITSIPTWASFLCLAVTLDTWSRRVIGWSMAKHLGKGLVLQPSPWPSGSGGRGL